jgi:hypothetical protein
MSWWSIAPGLAVSAAFLLWLAMRSRKYSRLFAPAHLAELGRQAHIMSRPGAARLRGKAGAVMPAGCRTAAGLTLVYSREPDGAEIAHHLSFAHQSGTLAHSAGLTLVAFVLDVLGVDLARVEVVISPQLNAHAGFRLSPQEQRAFDDRPAPALDRASVRTRLGQAMKERERWPGGRAAPVAPGSS